MDLDVASLKALRHQSSVVEAMKIVTPSMKTSHDHQSLLLVVGGFNPFDIILVKLDHFPR